MKIDFDQEILGVPFSGGCEPTFGNSGISHMIDFVEAGLGVQYGPSFQWVEPSLGHDHVGPR